MRSWRRRSAPQCSLSSPAAAACGGSYISHIRSESDDILAAIDELVTISRESDAPAIIYHLKQSGRDNWGKQAAIFEKVEQARAEGLDISATMYTYPAGSTGLDAAMPTWVQAGGYEKWAERLRDPATRARVAAEMRAPGRGWENLYYHAGDPARVILVGFRNDALKPYTGKTLAEVAALRGKSAEETAMDLVVEDGSRVQVIYFLMDEANVARQTALPWISFGSDAEAPATAGVFLKSSTHPRAYGNFARLLGKYVREEKVITVEEAVRRLTSLPADHLRLRERGRLAAGYFADVVVFDPATIQDHATFDKPHQLSTGVRDVFVNGVLTVENEAHTGAKAGRVLRGPGWSGWDKAD